jgi:hypothetical protein
MVEIWKPVKGYKGYYEVSNLGQVRSIVRPDTKHTGGTLSENLRSGYPSVILFKNGKKQHKRVHRIAAEAFIPNPLNLPCINHIDGDKCNYELSNLEWCTHKENMERRVNRKDFPEYTPKKYKIEITTTGSSETAPKIQTKVRVKKVYVKKGIPGMGRGNFKLSESEVNQLLDQYQQKVPILDILKNFNIGRKAFRKYLKRNNIQANRVIKRGNIPN